jgi:hypothetical protein
MQICITRPQCVNNSPQQWIPNPHHTQSKEKTESQKTATTTTKTNNPNSSTKQEMASLHLSQSINKKGD